MGKARGVTSFEAQVSREQKLLRSVQISQPDYFGGTFNNFPEPLPSVPRSITIDGGCLKGPLAFKDSIEGIVAGVIDVGRTKSGFSGFVTVQAETGTSDDLTDINNFAFPGQQIQIQADTGDTITIKNSGNIDTADGSDFVLGSNEVTYLVYTIKSASWVQMNQGAGGGGISFPVTPTILDNSDTWTSPVDIDLSLSTAHVTKFTLDGDLTLTFSSPPSSGTQIEFEIEFVQDGTGGHTVTFPATVVETVSVDETASTTTIITFRTNDGGTNYNAIVTVAGTIAGGGGGSQTPWLTEIDADGFELVDMGGIIFRDGGDAIDSTVSQIFSDASGDMTFNVATTDQYLWFIAGGTARLEMDVDSFKLNNPTDDMNNIDFVLTDTSPLNNDIPGRLRWRGFDDAAGGVFTYANIYAQMEDVSAGTKDGSLIFAGASAGGGADAEKNWMKMNAVNDSETWCYQNFNPNTSGLDLGSGTLEWDNLFVNTINPATGGTIGIVGGNMVFNANEITDIANITMSLDGDIQDVRDIYLDKVRFDADPTVVRMELSATGFVFDIAASGDVYDFDIGGANKVKIQDNAVTLQTGMPLIVNDTVTIQHATNAFLEMADIVDPATPSAGFAKIFLDSADDVYKIIHSDATVVSLEAGGGGATTELDNLGTVAINADLEVDTDDTYDLGKSGMQWDDLWIDGTANIDTLNLDSSAGLGMASSLMPTTDLTFDIGSQTQRWTVMHASVYRLPITTGDTTTRILSNTGGVDYHCLTNDRHDFFVNNARNLSVLGSGIQIGDSGTCLIDGSTVQMTLTVAAGDQFVFNVSGTGGVFTIQDAIIALGDPMNILLGTTTGTKLGSGTSEKLAFWGSTPVVQQSVGSDTLANLYTLLRAIGILA